MFTSFIQKCQKYNIGNKVIVTLITVATILLLVTYYAITKESNLLDLNPRQILTLALGDLVILLALVILLIRKFFKKSLAKGKNPAASKLQNRIVIAFSLVTAIPTIIISVFSAYFFNFGLQTWFDDRVSAVLDQSVIVAESYIDEHTIRLKETALSVADDLSDMYYDLVHNPEKFAKTLNGEAEMRSLSEAIVFQKSTNTILAQTPLSFAISVTTIPAYTLSKADHGEIVQIKSDPTKIRMLIKLREYQDTYLLVSRLVDEKIMDHVNKTNGAASQYLQLKTQISKMQIAFSIVFIFVALLLLFVAIMWGATIAGQIVSPIRKLVAATEKAQDGDLTVQVPEDQTSDDEIRVLSSAFNKMITRLDEQQKDLIVAQRAMAWSDVARRVAHEIKNPLTPIQLSAERLLKKFSGEVSDKDAFEKYANTILRHSNDIKKIVSEFVEFARLPSPTFSKYDIITLVKDIVESRKLINDKVSYNFTSSFDNLELVCDSTQINQVMINLLKNSEEALQNSINSKVSVSILQHLESLVILVEDNGVGFPPDLIDKVTEAYVTSRSKGTGLGLAIVKKIIQDHYGTIVIGNGRNGGAVVKLTFNLEKLKTKLKQSF